MERDYLSDPVYTFCVPFSQVAPGCSVIISTDMRLI